MPTALTTQQLIQYRNIIAAQGVDGAKQVYQSLYAQGYTYAGWAGGVASGDSVAGNYALDYLSGSAIMGLGGDQCQSMGSDSIGFRSRGPDHRSRVQTP